MGNDYAVFIVSYGRPDNIATLNALRKGNYNGDTYIIIDNEDESADEYKRRYGDMVIQFDKSDAAKWTDTADAAEDHRGVVYARNECFNIAKRLGLAHFVVLDDDYGYFIFRFLNGAQFKSKYCDDLNRLFEDCFEFLDVSGALVVALAQGGDLIGGANRFFHKGLSRKAMNVWFLKTDRPFRFVGRVNEDTNTYVMLGNRGKLFFTVTNTQITQAQTQKNAEGMTNLYLDYGTYVKSFYSVIVAPQAVKVAEMGTHHRRMHHRIDWNKCVPKIISDRYRKRR